MFCKYCGKEFAPLRFNQIYCGANCQQCHAQKRYREKHGIKVVHKSKFKDRFAVNLVCKLCLITFKFVGTELEIKNRKFCSKKCGIKNWHQTFRQNNGNFYSCVVRKLKKKTKYFENKCKLCGTLFWVTAQHLKRKKFCSDFCRKKDYNNKTQHGG